MNTLLPMHYCPICGSPIDVKIPEGDNRPRHVCVACGEIHYQNPRNVVGCLLRWEDKILLCRRSIEPRRGYWTLPAGFMENGETAMDGAARESREEACAEAESLRLFAVYSLPAINQVYLMYSGVLKDGYSAAGEESLETRLFLPEELPWDDMAFPVITETLRRLIDDGYPENVYLADLFRREDRSVEIVRHN